MLVAGPKTLVGMVSVVLLVVLFAPVGMAQSSCASTDMCIARDKVTQDTIMVLRGDLIVREGATYTLERSELTFRATESGETPALIVEQGATLNLRDSNIVGDGVAFDLIIFGEADLRRGQIHNVRDILVYDDPDVDLERLQSEVLLDAMDIDFTRTWNIHEGAGVVHDGGKVATSPETGDRALWKVTGRYSLDSGALDLHETTTQVTGRMVLVGVDGQSDDGLGCVQGLLSISGTMDVLTGPAIEGQGCDLTISSALSQIRALQGDALVLGGGGSVRITDAAIRAPTGDGIVVDTTGLDLMMDGAKIRVEGTALDITAGHHDQFLVQDVDITASTPLHCTGPAGPRSTIVGGEWVGIQPIIIQCPLRMHGTTITGSDLQVTGTGGRMPFVDVDAEGSHLHLDGVGTVSGTLNSISTSQQGSTDAHWPTGPALQVAHLLAFADRDGDALMDDGEALILSSTGTTTAGDIVLDEQAFGSRLGESGIKARPLTGSMAAIDLDQDGVIDGYDMLTFDSDRSQDVSAGDLVLSGPLAGIAVDAHHPYLGDALVSTAFRPLAIDTDANGQFDGRDGLVHDADNDGAVGPGDILLARPAGDDGPIGLLYGIGAGAYLLDAEIKGTTAPEAADAKVGSLRSDAGDLVLLDSTVRQGAFGAAVAIQEGTFYAERGDFVADVALDLEADVRATTIDTALTSSKNRLAEGATLTGFADFRPQVIYRNGVPVVGAAVHILDGEDPLASGITGSNGRSVGLLVSTLTQNDADFAVGGPLTVDASYLGLQATKTIARDQADKTITLLDEATPSALPGLALLSDPNLPDVQVRWDLAEEDHGDASYRLRLLPARADAQIVGPDGFETFEATELAVLDSNQYSFTLPGQGDYILEVTPLDISGNAGEPGRLPIVWDTQDPTLDLEITGPEGDDDWYTGPVQVRVLADDDRSHIQSVRVFVDGRAVLPRTDGTYRIQEDGFHRMEVRVTDAGGNSVETTRQFRVDSTAPILPVLVPEKTLLRESTWISFRLDGDLIDRLSGAREVRIERLVSEDGNPTLVERVLVPLPDTLELKPPEGVSLYRIVGVDRAGNEATGLPTRVLVDTVAPTPLVEIGREADPSRPYLLKFQDAGRIVQITAWIDGQLVASSTTDQILVDISSLSEGSHSLRVMAVDEAGNVYERESTMSVISEDQDAPAPALALLLVALLGLARRRRGRPSDNNAFNACQESVA